MAGVSGVGREALGSIDGTGRCTSTMGYFRIDLAPAMRVNGVR